MYNLAASIHARLKFEADGVDFDARSVVCEDIHAQDEHAGIRVKLRATIGKAVAPLQAGVAFGDALAVAPEEITFPEMLDMAAPKYLSIRLFKISQLALLQCRTRC